MSSNSGNNDASNPSSTGTRARRIIVRRQENSPGSYQIVSQGGPPSQADLQSAVQVIRRMDGHPPIPLASNSNSNHSAASSPPTQSANNANEPNSASQNSNAPDSTRSNNAPVQNTARRMPQRLMEVINNHNARLNSNSEPGTAENTDNNNLAPNPQRIQVIGGNSDNSTIPREIQEAIQMIDRLENSNNGPTASTSTTIPGVALPPLEAKKAAFKPKPVAKDEEKNETAMRDFECAICFEFMEDPTGCGRCDARFCCKCIHRACMSNSTSSKCPYCRNEIKNISDLQRDIALKRRMDQVTIKKECPYPNCTQVLPLSKMKEHEAECEFMPMKCKFCEFGCTWSGPRKDLESHYKVGCSFAPVEKVVEELRRCKHEHNKMVRFVQQQFVRERHITRHQIEAVAGFQMRRLGNVFDMAYLFYYCVCHPDEFLRNKAVWGCFWSSHNSRATVNNVMYFLPTSLWVCKIGLTGVFTLQSFMNRKTEEYEWDMINVMVQSLCIVSLWLLFILCFITDTGTSTSWGSFSSTVPLFGNTIRGSLMKHSATFASFFLHLGCIDFDNWGSGWAGYLWIMLMMYTIFFPPMVECMLKVANSELSENTPIAAPSGKAYEVVVFGMKYSMLICGGGSKAIDAIILYQILSSILPKTVVHRESECFFSNLDTIVTTSIGIAFSSRLAWFKEGEYTKNMVFNHLTILLAFFAILLAVNYMLVGAQKNGVTLGKKIALYAKTSEGSPRDPGRIYDFRAASFFVIWSILILIPSLTMTKYEENKM